jgi:hypothetical protein
VLQQKYYFPTKMRIYKIYALFFGLLLLQLTKAQGIIQINNTIKTVNDIKVGAARMQEYLPLLKDKAVAIVANQSSCINQTHLVDTLVSLGISVKKVF